MILGTGLDLIEVRRIGKMLEKEHSRRRIFTEGENEHIERKGVQSAAGIWAAKEAVSKTLGTGFSGFGPWDIEIFWNEAGLPLCRLSGGALERYRAIGGGRIHLSITHVAEMAAAMAILTDEPEL